MPVARPESDSRSACSILDPFTGANSKPWLPGDREIFQPVARLVRDGPSHFQRMISVLLALSIGGFLGTFWLPRVCSRVRERAQHFTREEKRPARPSQSSGEVAPCDLRESAGLVCATALHVFDSSLLKALLQLAAPELDLGETDEGAPVPVFKLGDEFRGYTLKDGDGKLVQLEEFLGRKPIVLEFGSLT